LSRRCLPLEVGQVMTAARQTSVMVEPSRPANPPGRTIDRFWREVEICKHGLYRLIEDRQKWIQSFTDKVFI
jgi:hypothetical protein